MNPASVAQVLSNTYSGDQQARVNAEEQLKSIEKTPNYLSCLLEIVSASGQLEQPVRLSASLRLKNILRIFWMEKVVEGKPRCIVENDRNVIKGGLVSVIVAEPSEKIKKILLDSLFVIVRGRDFPGSWPGLVPEIVQNIETDDEKRIYAGVLMLKVVFGKYRFMREDRRGDVNELMNLTYPRLLQIAAICFQNPSSSTHTIIHIICKIFCFGVHMSIPPLIKSAQALSPWIEFL